MDLISHTHRVRLNGTNNYIDYIDTRRGGRAKMSRRLASNGSAFFFKSEFGEIRRVMITGSSYAGRSENFHGLLANPTVYNFVEMPRTFRQRRLSYRYYSQTRASSGPVASSSLVILI